MPRIFVPLMFAALFAGCGGGQAVPPAGGAAAPAPAEPVQTPSVSSITGTTKIGLFQIFDEFHHTIYPTQAVADGPRYNVIWGARVGMAQYWRQNAPNLKVSYYIPMSTDFSTSSWGAIGHTLTWWQANHPTWILYACNSSGPTHTVVYQGGWSGQIPLDIHNPQVVTYQIRAAAAFAKAHDYNAIAVDEVLLFNADYNHTTGYYSCGIWVGSTFIRRYSSNQYDPNAAADTVAWVKQAHPYFTSQALTMIVNSPHGSTSNANVQAVLANTDYDLDETGFTNYGHYTASSGLVPYTIAWMEYAQSIGTRVLMNYQFSNTTPLAAPQREYTVATYLLADEAKAFVYSGPTDDYGGEMYYPMEYTTNYGAPCSKYVQHGNGTYTRRFSGALAVVNSTTSAQSLALPAQAFTDLEGRSITNPLRIAASDAYVLKTTNGCSLPSTF